MPVDLWRASRPSGTFARRYGRAPAASAWAPGSVLCLHGTGEAAHEALFVSLPLGARVFVAPRDDASQRCACEGDAPLFEPGEARATSSHDDEVARVVGALRASGLEVPGLDVLIAHDLPGRTGFGTGAARRVALVRAIAALLRVPLDDVRVAAVASRDGGGALPRLSEIAAACGHPGHWLLVDATTGHATVVPMPDTAEIALVASGAWRQPGSRGPVAPAVVDSSRIRATTRALHASALLTAGALMQHRPEMDDAADEADRRAEFAWADPRVYGARAWRAQHAGGILALCRRGAARDVARRVLARGGEPWVLLPGGHGAPPPSGGDRAS